MEMLQSGAKTIHLTKASEANKRRDKEVTRSPVQWRPYCRGQVLLLCLWNVVASPAGAMATFPLHLSRQRMAHLDSFSITHVRKTRKERNVRSKCHVIDRSVFKTRRIETCVIHLIVAMRLAILRHDFTTLSRARRIADQSKALTTTQRRSRSGFKASATCTARSHRHRCQHSTGD